MQSIQLPDTSTWDGASVLSGLGIIVAEGADAATFLHGQLSQDMSGLPSDQGRLAAYCSAKGRMLASFVALRPSAETFWLVADESVLAATLKRLSMFVMRSKVKLQDGTSTLKAVGLVGPSAKAWLGDAAKDQAGAVALHEASSGLVMRLADVQGVARWMWLGPVSQADALSQALPSLAADQWSWLDVMSGVARIQLPTVDQFVPQMVNYEVVGGVNFSKGCYPGQEVVARSQYRGTAKRRAFVVHSAQQVEPGQEIFAESDPAQPAGMVINASPIPGGGSYSALVELKLNVTGSALHLQSADGPNLILGELPYSLPAAE